MKIFRSIYDYLRLVIHRRFYSLKSIQKYQKKQLKKLYQYATTNSEFYKNKYQDQSFITMDDFYKLPTINKTVMMDNFSTLNTCGLDKDDVLEFAIQKENDKDYLGYYKDDYVIGLSSGTSGNKGIYITPKKMTERLPAVFLARGGFPLSLLPYRILFVLRVFSQGFEDINSKLVTLNYVSTMEDIQTVIKTINSKKINIIMAPPSFIRELLPYKDEIKVEIKKIMSYAEVLEKDDKLNFERAFKTNVIEIYQASEGQIASACKHGHLHINEDMVFVELYDKNNNIITEEDIIGHKMIITNLVNYAQPLIRYEMNDMVILDKKCECGSNFRRIKKVLGRHDDLIYFFDDTKKKRYIFPDLFVRWIIVSSENIREFRVNQTAVNEVIIHLDLINKDAFDPSEIVCEKIEYELSLFNINNAKIMVELKEIEIPKEKNKYKRFVNSID